MSKQLTPFEALDIVAYDYGYDENVIIIEKSLKALEIIKDKKIDMYKLQNCFDFKLSNKKHIHKCVHGNMILEEEINESDATEYYNKDFDFSYQITPKEFDLLKEVLK